MSGPPTYCASISIIAVPSHSLLLRLVIIRSPAARSLAAYVFSQSSLATTSNVSCFSYSCAALRRSSHLIFFGYLSTSTACTLTLCCAFSNTLYIFFLTRFFSSPLLHTRVVFALLRALLCIC